jgi:N-acyl-L-homoserine lactone synthetase
MLLERYTGQACEVGSRTKPELKLFLARKRCDYDAIFALRYRAYQCIGAVPENAACSFSDDFDIQCNAFSFGIRADDRLVGSIRVVVSACGGRDLTAYGAFSDAIHATFSKTDRVVEANRFVIDPSFKAGQASLDHQLLLFRALVAVAMIVNADYYVGAARRNHLPFYQRVVFMRPITEERIYPGLNVPMRLLTGHFPTNYDKVCLRYGDRLRIGPEERDRWEASMVAT